MRVATLFGRAGIYPVKRSGSVRHVGRTGVSILGEMRLIEVSVGVARRGMEMQEAPQQ